MGPPKRMSDVLASSAATRLSPLPTTTPYSSDGPTLPIVGAGEHSSTIALPQGQKRKRAAASHAAADTPTAQRPRTNHPSLYEPWLLLGGRERKALHERGTASVQVLVFSRNQNVRAGINRLKECLGAKARSAGASALDPARGEEPKDEGACIAVSAQGDGAVKLVGVVDMVRRIVGQTARNGGDEGQEQGDGVKWYLYTVLGKVVVPRKQGAAGAETRGVDAAVGDPGDVMDIDGDDADRDDAAAQATPQSKEEKTKTVPVLTVWMTRKRLPPFRDAFGEQNFVVHKIE